MSRAWKDAATVILASRCTRKAVNKFQGAIPCGSQDFSENQPGDLPGSAESVRDNSPSFDYKVLMLGRSSKSPFMPSAYVFPGGKIGGCDFSERWCDIFRDVFGYKALKEYSLSRLGILQPPKIVESDETSSSDSDEEGEGKPPARLPLFQAHDGRGRDVSSEIAFRIAAIRETFEESGILLCTNKDKLDLDIDPEKEEVRIDRSQIHNSCLRPGRDIDENKLASWRREVVKDDTKFVEMCADLNVVPNVWVLHDWCCWLTPAHMPKMHNKRRFDTAFYLTCLSDMGLPTPEHDDIEVSSAEWSDPLDLLCRYYSEELWLAPPQIYELCRLCSKAHLDDLHQFAVTREKSGWQRWLPVRIACDDGTIAVLPGDELYPQEPDFEGVEPPLSVPQSVSELRTSTMAHHRFEFLGMHNTAILSTTGPTHHHLSPNYGSQAWDEVRESYQLAALQDTKKTGL